jgi:glycosyltransferase involved in cell wall biosynthesis
LARRRIVLSAFAFSPARGSEPGIGWNIASRLADFHDITVLTCPALGGENHRTEVDEYFQRHGPIPGLEIRHIEPPRLSRWFQKPLISFSTPLYFVGYAAWQRAAFAEARRLHKARPFDLAHQLTITGFREPGYLWKLGIPFVWGPVAGAANVPWRFFMLFSIRDRIFYTLKNTVNTVHKRLKFRSKRAARIAKYIFVTSHEDQALITGRWGNDSHLMPDTGTPDLDGNVRDFDGNRPLRLVWSGLHAGRKGLPILLNASAKLKRELPGHSFTLKILGDGPQSRSWKSLARDLGINDLISWTGQLPRDRALEEMRGADVFVFTSLQEGTSSVVMEALALGLPVICHDACGMAIAIDESCGIKIPMVNPGTSERRFADAIKSLVTDPGRARTLSAGALARARQLSWSLKAEQIAAVYDAILSRGGHV